MRINADLNAICEMAPSLTREEVWKRCTSTVHPNSVVVRSLRDRLSARYRPWLAFSSKEAAAILDEFFHRLSHPYF